MSDSLKLDSFLALGHDLCIVANPMSLFNVGFQLSFLAVGGIVYFQPLLYNLLNFKHKSIFNL